MRRSRVAAAILVGLVAASAHAKVTGDATGFVVRYPSGDASNPGELQQLMANPAVSTIVFEKGTQLFSSRLFVFKRNDLTLCGATGDPKDVIIESSATPVFQIEQAQGTVFRGLTIHSTFVPMPGQSGGIGVLVNAVPGPTTEGFADDTTIDKCAFESYVGVQASVRTTNLSVSNCAFRSAPISPGSTSGGVGLLWEDGPGLFVTKSKFTTLPDVEALAAIFVRGAQTPSSAGDRAKQLFLTRNTIQGDFTAGFDLADLKDAVVRQNKFKFKTSVVPGVKGRVGMVVRRAGATQFTEDYELSSNTVKGAHYGLWLVGVGMGDVTKNTFRGCGSPDVDETGPTGFNDRGGAVRVNLLGGSCQTTFTGNDMRKLRSPLEVPAVVLFPVADACDEAQNPGNRTDPGRAVFGGQPE